MKDLDMCKFQLSSVAKAMSLKAAISRSFEKLRVTSVDEKAYTIHLPNGPPTIMFFAITCTVEQVAMEIEKQEKIDVLHYYRMYTMIDAKSILMESNKMLLEYPSCEIHVKPRIRRISTQQECMKYAEQPVNRRRSSIFESPTSKTTHIRMAQEYAAIIPTLKEAESSDSTRDTIGEYSSGLKPVASQPDLGLISSYNTMVKSGSVDLLSKSAAHSRSFNTIGSESVQRLNSRNSEIKIIEEKNENFDEQIRIPSPINKEFGSEGMLRENLVSLPETISRRRLNTNVRLATLRKQDGKIRMSISPIDDTKSLEDKRISSIIMDSSLISSLTTDEQQFLASPAYFLFESKDESIPRIFLKVSLPQLLTTTMVRVPEYVMMEDLLRYLSIRRRFKFESYTLAVPKNSRILSNVISPNKDELNNKVESFHKIENTNLNQFDQNVIEVELDRTVKYYKDTLDIKEVIVISAPKSYSMICINEDGQDVMVYQLNKGKMEIVALTEEKIIEKLANDEEIDNSFSNMILLTFRNFIKPEQILLDLIDRFYALPPQNPTSEDISYFVIHKNPTQRRVLEVVHFWIEFHWHDFASSSDLREDVIQFVKDAKSEISEFETLCDNLLKLIEKQQLALFNFKLFKNVHPIEFLNKIWLPPKQNVDEDEIISYLNDPHPNLSFFISRFDIESFWVATEVCAERDLKKRQKTLKRFINLAYECKELNNFFSTLAILGGLNMSCVQRLKKTWDGLNSKAKNQYDELEKLSNPSRNMKALRDAITAAKPPILPFLPIYLKDLTFINDGNPSKIHGMINFEKLRMMGQRVLEISSLVNHSYPFDEKPEVQNYLKKPFVEKDIQKLKDWSVLCEP
ncbi:Guanine-nucleotide dissociation stimulator CDC25 domain-containing protein [Rozella allomycis CSF55]|uniref:Guanine-nucleotide dissociation stimulator CDC25 domain-containing protein n=1 Tax=Rozella allomycis (strain CSF55) TaxID=988480 RepID=A0A075B379_ROZAC|nr:Guanine-nucleotide dissociation stimulator CDC25 domain-containing protein [Rozella allomycis CSF55]|eukprot:EPZ36809.1 Guanine-nucleotide dissociation stimulator CDC25 domain-containing protein [Rozella allomycis CSF55]